MRSKLLASVFASLLAMGSVASAQTIDTRTSGSGIWESGHRYAGQSFTALTNSLLTTSLWITSQGQYMNFEAKLQAWDTVNDQVTGAVLWTSAPWNFWSSSEARADFWLGGVTLTPGDLYVFFIDFGFMSNPNGMFTNASFSDTYAGGTAVYGGTGSGPVFEYGLDTKFEAVFVPQTTVTPEPASVVMLATGLIGVLGVTARRRSQA